MAAGRTGWCAGQVGKGRPDSGHALLNLVGVVPDEGITLVIIEAELVGDPPCCFLLEV